MLFDSVLIEVVKDECVVEIMFCDDWGEFGFDFYFMDVDVYLGDDFFCYVNGIWYDEFEMLVDCMCYGVFLLLCEKLE